MIGNSLQINKLLFFHIQLCLYKNNLENIFRNKNNKTLFETVSQGRYLKYKSEVLTKYKEYLFEPLGEFLYMLKTQGDNFYSLFLNLYGDETYSKFGIKNHLDEIGLYTFVLDANIVYIGKTTDSIGRRINYGYGNISPKNCYLDGQATNCHLNALITKYWENISFYFHQEENHKEIHRMERELIGQIQPIWNIALKTKRSSI